MVSINVEADCGNSPKNLFLRDFHVALAKQDADMVLANVADDVTWEVVGQRTVQGKADFTEALEKGWATALDSVTLEHVITHGKVGSANGTLTTAEGATYGFCNICTFASHAKNASIRTITSYLIRSSGE